METLFTPKAVCGEGDWLVTQREAGQTIQDFQQGGPLIRMLDRVQKVIYLFLIDDSIDDQTGEHLKLYCEAFFLGVEVRLVRAGSVFQDKDSQGRPKNKKIPKNFVQANQIT